MPNRTPEDSAERESSQNIEHSEQGESQKAAGNATRRRRGGRRVVRGTGAADAPVPVQVEAKEREQVHTRRRTRAASTAEDADTPTPTVDGADSEGERKPARKTSRRRTTRGQAAASGEGAASRSRARRSSRSGEAAAGETDGEDSRDRRSEEAEERPVRRRSVRRKAGEETGRSGRSGRDEQAEDGGEDEGSGSPRRGRHRVQSGRSVGTRSAGARSRQAQEADSGEDNADAETKETKPAKSARGRSGRTQSPARPMTSLLFQEPVIPAAAVAEDEAEEDEEETGSGRHAPARRSRVRKTRSGGNHAAEHDDADERRDEDGEERPRRRRRLNAEERRAADEVGQIEQDLHEDDIRFVNDESEEDEEPKRTRRRRRSQDKDEDEPASERSERGGRRRKRKGEEAEEDEGGLTRRRRRRRGAKDADEEPARRSRRQQYVDEITDIEGSTRLEAKKQRRRDNRRERSRQTQLVEQDFLARRENVDRQMVVREKEHHTQVSVIEDGILVEHYVSDIDEVSSVGNIYLGRVQNVLPSMEAAFVDVGQARNGVLYAGEVNWDATRLEGQPRRIELAFKSGDPVLVQVTKDPIGHKGARLTAQITLAGRFLVLVPSGGMTGVSRKLPDKERARLKSIVSRIAPKDMGVIIRTAAEGASEEAIEKDLGNLQRQWEDVEAKRQEFWHGKRPKLLQGEPDVAIRVVRDIFNDDFNRLVVQGERVYGHIEHYLDTMAPDLKDKLERWDPAEHQGKDVFDKWQIDSQLRKGMERQVYLPSGGSLVIDRTEAMTTIDVNTGRFIGKGKSLEETVTRCNLEAAEEIARQLRLRDIGGMVMIDFVDMVLPANRDLVLRRLVECLARDRTKHQVAEVTSLGLVQMTRKRVGQGLVEAFSEECPSCHGRGFILHDQPTISAKYDDPYAVKGGDPFVKTNKHGHGSKASKEAPAPKGSSPDVKAKLAQIAAAAEKASEGQEDEGAGSRLDDRDDVVQEA
ncbi:Rne/Rng family ribonuclease [Bifidobacterium xylocopae]|uniref:Rne/Rng family ribonuclease n=1 Tax=Bifidobacterium xylocopae TaxID=2493119 RepID=UPI0026CACFFE